MIRKLSMNSLQRQHFNNQANRYDTRRIVNPPAYIQRELHEIHRALSLPIGSHIIDFGSGNGRLTLYFLSLGYHVMAIDISRSSLQELTALYKQYKTPSWGSLTTRTTLPQTPSVNGIIGADILHHVDMPTVLPLLRHALRPNGTMVFSEPNGRNILWYIFLILKRLPWSIERGIVHCTYNNLQVQFTQASFCNIRILPYGFSEFRLIVSAQKRGRRLLLSPLHHP